MLLLAVDHDRTLTGEEQARCQAHLAGCETCGTLAAEPADERFRWIARLPDDAFDDPDLLVLPTVDPIVFAKGDELAHGGMGRITRARDRRLGRDIAIKEVLGPHLRARFEREAMITARLQHPAIVPIYEAGAWPDGSAFYTMRLVAGGTLGDAIAKTHTLEDRLALLPHVLAITEALGYAHAQRIVHRDLKPGNVLVGEFGETVVIDWGLAKELDRRVDDAGDGDAPTSIELTRAGTVVGTPCFLAPEQAAGAAIDERADVYALGAILYNVLAGHPPHWDSIEHSADRLIDAARDVPPTPIEQLAPRVPADLRVILERAMAHDRAARYPTAKAMAEELRRFEAGQLLASRSYRLRDLVVRWIRRHRAAVAVGAIAIAVLAIGGVLGVQQIVARERETAHALAESQLEQGRQLLVDGAPGKAAPYIAGAFAALPDDPVARRLAALALRDTPRRLGSFAGAAAAFRRDGRELAIGRADGSIAVIDPATSATLRTLAPLGGAIAQLDYAPDGGQLAVASADGAYLRDAATGARTATASELPAFEVKFFPRGDRVAIAGATAVRLVALDGTPVASDADLLTPHGLAVSPDGTTVVAVTRDGALAWRASDLTRIAEVRAAGVARFAAAYDHGELITAGVDGLRRWGAGDRVTTLVADPVVMLSWIDDRTLLVDGAIVRIDTGLVRRLTRNSVQAAVLIDRSHVLTGGYDRTLRVWDLERPARPVVVLDAAGRTTALAVDPTGQRAFTRGAGAGAPVELWDVAPAAAPIRTAVVGPQIDALLVDHRGRLAVHVQDGAASATKLVTAELEVVATLSGWPVGFRPNRDELVTDLEGRLLIYASRDGRHLRDIVDPPKQWHVAFSPSDSTIATSSERRVSLRDADWRVITGFDVPADVSALALDDHGRVVTGHDDGTLRIWDARAGTLLATAAGHTAHINQVAIRGETLVTGSWDQTTRLWAFPSGEPRGILKTFDKLTSNVALSPGGQLIATADSSGVVDLWDGAQGRLLVQIPTSADLAYLAFLDDDHLVGGGAGGRLELIDLSARQYTAAEVTRLVTTSSRWQLVHGRAVERRSSWARTRGRRPPLVVDTPRSAALPTEAARWSSCAGGPGRTCSPPSSGRCLTGDARRRRCRRCERASNARHSFSGAPSRWLPQLRESWTEAAATAGPQAELAATSRRC
jgi:eukaryotic-like serine/threonine-protein kinase